MKMNLPLKVKLKVILLTLLNTHLNNNIMSEPIQIFKHYSLKKQLIRMPQNMHYWLMKQPPHQVRNMLLHLQKYLRSKKYLQRAKKLHQNWLLIRMPQCALLADETATTSGEEHVASPPEVSKVKEIPTKGQKAAPKLVVNQNATKHALLADDTATTSGEKHVALPTEVSKVKEIPTKGQKAAPKLVVNQNATKHALLADETATTSGKEHVTSNPKVSEVVHCLNIVILNAHIPHKKYSDSKKCIGSSG